MNYIKRILERYCLSQLDFALVLGMDRTYLNKLLRGHIRPHPHTVKKLAVGLAEVTGDDWLHHADQIRGDLNE